VTDYTIDCSLTDTLLVSSRERQRQKLYTTGSCSIDRKNYMLRELYTLAANSSLHFTNSDYFTTYL